MPSGHGRDAGQVAAHSCPPKTILIRWGRFSRFQAPMSSTSPIDNFLGSGKQASSQEANGLDNVAIAGALELARDPAIFASAFVLKQAQDMLLQQQQQAGAAG